MPNYNKQKGKSFEREIAKHLTSVFGLNFERVWSSGAFTGGKNFARRDNLTPAQLLLTDGDIIVPEQLAHISIECKFYKAFSFTSLFSTNKMLDKWIAQASETTRQWFLIFKINGQGAFVVFDSTLPFTLPGNVLKYHKYHIVPLEGFFELNKETLLHPSNISVQSHNGQNLTTPTV